MLIHRHSAVKPKGHTSTVYHDGSTAERDTLCCCHCGAHWEVVPGSGRTRGWCMKCMGVTCGREQCERVCCPEPMRVEEPEKAARILPDLFTPRRSARVPPPTVLPLETKPQIIVPFIHKES